MSLAQIGLAPSWFLCKKLMEVAGPVITKQILLLGDPVPAKRLYDSLGYRVIATQMTKALADESGDPTS